MTLTSSFLQFPVSWSLYQTGLVHSCWTQLHGSWLEHSPANIGSYELYSRWTGPYPWRHTRRWRRAHQSSHSSRCWPHTLQTRELQCPCIPPYIQPFCARLHLDIKEELLRTCPDHSLRLNKILTFLIFLTLWHVLYGSKFRDSVFVRVLVIPVFSVISVHSVIHILRRNRHHLQYNRAVNGIGLVKKAPNCTPGVVKFRWLHLHIHSLRPWISLGGGGCPVPNWINDTEMRACALIGGRWPTREYRQQMEDDDVMRD